MNVGFSLIVQNMESYSDLVKGRMTLEEQLQYKFLVSLQGNDVASGLKWHKFQIPLMVPVYNVF